MRVGNHNKDARRKEIVSEGLAIGTLFNAYGGPFMRVTEPLGTELGIERTSPAEIAEERPRSHENKTARPVEYLPLRDRMLPFPYGSRRGPDSYRAFC
jgi:hypothetical protein